jgi:hypothetical protein
MSRLILKRAKVSRPSGQWRDDDYDVICEGAVVGRHFLSSAAPQDRQWMWTLAYGAQPDYDKKRAVSAMHSLLCGCLVPLINPSHGHE